jgi:Tol biopolymer transport system component
VAPIGRRGVIVAALTAAGVASVLAVAASAARGFPIAPADLVGVRVSSGNRTAVVVRLSSGDSRIVVTTAQVPRVSRLSGLGISARQFSDAVLSPDRRLVALATLGMVHGWVGLLDLGTGRIREFQFFYAGHAADLVWAPNGRYLAMTEHGPSGLRAVGVYSTRTGSAHEPLGKLLTVRFFDRSIETYEPSWSGDGRRLVFKASPEDAGLGAKPMRWVVGVDGLGLRRLP